MGRPRFKSRLTEDKRLKMERVYLLLKTGKNPNEEKISPVLMNFVKSLTDEYLLGLVDELV